MRRESPVLTARFDRIAALADRGMMPKEIASEVGCHQSVVTKILRRRGHQRVTVSPRVIGLLRTMTP